MVLQKQNFFLSLAQGISTKEDSKQVVPGKLLTLENGTFINPKEIRKRYGNVPLKTEVKNNEVFDKYDTIPENINNGNFIASFNEEIIINDNLNLYSYSEGLDSWTFKNKNTISSLNVNPVIRDTRSQFTPDSAIDPTGLQMFAWEDDIGGCRVSIIDTITGQIIESGYELTPLTSGLSTKPKCVYINGYLVVFYLDTSVAMGLYFVTYRNGEFSTPEIVVPDVNITYNNYDVSVLGRKIYVSYNSTTNSIKNLYLTDDFQISFTTTLPAINANNAITVFTDAITGYVWVGYANSTDVTVFILNNALDTVLLQPTGMGSATTIHGVTGVVKNNYCTIFYDSIGSADSNGQYINAFTRVTEGRYEGGVNFTDLGNSLFLKSTGLHSKAFLVTINDIEIPHVVLVRDAYLQPTYFLCNLFNLNQGSIQPTAHVVTKIAPSVAGSIPINSSSLASVNEIATNVFQTAVLQKDNLTTFTIESETPTVVTYSPTGVMAAEFNFNQTNPSISSLGQNLQIGSGILSMYDGANVVEHGFHLYPEYISTVVNTSGGNLNASSAYGYQTTYEWVDNQGQLHRSAPSPIISITTAGGSNDKQVALTCETLRVTAKQNVTMVFYRTTANGTVYYRLNSPLNPVFNDTTTDSVVYIDNASDASIIANEQLYTTGGEVVNISAPSTKFIGEYKNRLILIPSDSDSSFWYSKQVIPGYPVEFSNRFVENVGSTGGPITAFMEMDSNGIFFKKNTLFYITGDGPSPSGSNNTFTQAANIPSDVGCINDQSLVLTPMGIMFKSNKGIYLLDRSLSVGYIGSDVEKYNEFNVTSAKLISYTNQVRFTLENGVVLVYDYFVKQWSVFTNIDATSSVIIEDNFTYIQRNGLVLRETKDVFNDNGAFIKLKIVTSWLSLAGLQGFQRIYQALILGKYYGTHKLLTEIAYDFNPITTQQTYFDVTKELNSNIYGQDPTYGLNSPYGGNYPTYQWRLFTDRQVCEAIQFTISDVPIAGPYLNNQGNIKTGQFNESLSLSAITLECGVKKGANKMPSNRSKG